MIVLSKFAPCKVGNFWYGMGTEQFDQFCGDSSSCQVTVWLGIYLLDKVTLHCLEVFIVVGGDWYLQDINGNHLPWSANGQAGSDARVGVDSLEFWHFWHSLLC